MNHFSRLFTICLVFLSKAVFGQVLYDPQQLYDGNGGLFDHDSLRTISIDFYEPNYHQILVEGWETQSGVGLPAAVWLSNGEFLDSVSIRYKGNSTFSVANDNDNPKLPLNLDINDIVSGQRLMNHKKIKLANSLFDPTFCKEIIAYDIYRRYLPSGQANFMKVNLEGEYLGLYVNTQSVDKQFLKQHFNEDEGVLFKCDPIAQYGQVELEELVTSNLEWLGADSTLYYEDYTIKSDYGWTELLKLIESINSPLYPLDSILNVDRVLWAFAVNTVLLNLDTYNGLYQHNYYLYQTRDGLFQMIPWDLTETFVGALLNFNPNIDEMYEYNPYNGYNSWWKPLCHQLTSDEANPFYRKLYTAHIRTVMQESLDATAIGNKVNELQALAVSAAFADQNQMFGTSEYYSNVDAPFVIPNGFATAGILSSIAAREIYLSSLSDIMAIPPTITSSDIFHVGDFAFVTAEASNASTVELMVTISPYNSKFKSFPMLDDGTNGDQVEGDGVYTAPLAFQASQSDIKYYIRAQNADAFILDPQRAEYEFYIYDRSVRIEEEISVNLKIYPNPASLFLTIETSRFHSINYEIRSVLGELILSGKMNSSKHRVDVSLLTNGIYLLKVADKTVKVILSK